ncbi:MAG: hypothetical protein IPH88_15610 [Bacteroidales bacterium]|nr:hypothetical protein [Bacteroidales bacterium]
MADPLRFRDNNKVSVLEKSEEDLAALDNIANKSINDLMNGNDNLIVYASCTEDKIEEQTIFSLYSDKTLRTYNLVGFVGRNNIQINIGSRFSEEIGKQYFIKYMLQRIHKLNLIDFTTTYDNTCIWEQLLYFIFPVFLKNAYNQGIYKVYKKRQFNDSNLKGKIEIGKHIKTNLPFNGKIAYCNKEFSVK